MERLGFVALACCGIDGGKLRMRGKGGGIIHYRHNHTRLITIQKVVPHLRKGRNSLAQSQKNEAIQSKPNLHLATASNKQPLIITTRLTLDPMRKTLLKPVMIRALNLFHMISIPMNSHNSVCEEVVFRAHAGHRIFEEEGVAHSFVGSGSGLVEGGAFHVS